jgi:hypothetical protein
MSWFVPTWKLTSSCMRPSLLFDDIIWIMPSTPFTSCSTAVATDCRGARPGGGDAEQ